jgi:colanic acid/amylovoran biosynthesis glycosyltransferase
MITMVHLNEVEQSGQLVSLDRKFHDGMCQFARRLDVPLVSVNPAALPGAKIMDRVKIERSQLPYQLLVVQRKNGRLEKASKLALADVVARSSLVVGLGSGMGAFKYARTHGKKYISLFENDLWNEIHIKKVSNVGMPRLAWAALCSAVNYLTDTVPAMKGAYEVHCNGYPAFDSAARIAKRRLFFLDSRMDADLIISEDRMEDRLKSLPSRPIQLIFSGRFEPMKGPIEAMIAAKQCRESGMNVEMDCYGSGSLVAEMKCIANDAGSWLRVHDAVPFPVLIEQSKNADVFICCHLQSDPSCTYLEAMGCGLPIVGYPNRMWNGMVKDSSAGVVAEHQTTDSLTAALSGFLKSPERLATATRNARLFALNHSFSMEFEKRVQAMKRALD